MYQPRGFCDDPGKQERDTVVVVLLLAQHTGTQEAQGMNEQ